MARTQEGRAFLRESHNRIMAYQQVAIIGAGLMGSGIGLEFAVRGHSVTIFDASPVALQRAPEEMRRGAATMSRLGLAPAAAADSVLERVATADSLAQAVERADFVLEAISEDLERKQKVFAELDRFAPAAAILGSNTSTFMPSALAAATARGDRVLVTHYFNPPHLLPVVEVVPHPGTAASVVESIRALYESMSKRPVVLQREVPGFVANRLQQALLREATALVAAGVASAADVDRVVTGSFGRRLAVAGPFEVSDLAGLDVIAAIAAELWPDLDSSGEVAGLLAEPAAAGNFGAKTGVGFAEWDDAKITAAKARVADALAAIAQLEH